MNNLAYFSKLIRQYSPSCLQISKHCLSITPHFGFPTPPSQLSMLLSPGELVLFYQLKQLCESISYPLKAFSVIPMEKLFSSLYSQFHIPIKKRKQEYHFLHIHCLLLCLCLLQSYSICHAKIQNLQITHVLPEKESKSFIL